MSEFKSGDLVRLKSGGPVMTVQYKTAMSEQLLCQWFVGTKLEQGQFRPEALVRVDSDETK